MSYQNHGWTAERKAKQALAIHRWRPWDRATGPKSPEGKARVSRNGFKGGKRAVLRREVAALRKCLRGNGEYLSLLHAIEG